MSMRDTELCSPCTVCNRMQSPPPPNPLSRHTHLQEEQRRANEGHSALQPLHRLQEVARAGDTAAHIVGGYQVGVQIPLQRSER